MAKAYIKAPTEKTVTRQLIVTAATDAKPETPQPN
jgi:hypothetical protein